VGSTTLPRFFWDCLELGGDRPALLTERESVSYSSLVERIERFTKGMRSLLPEALARPLVLVEATHELDSIVAYLACLRARYPVILVAEGQSTPASQIASTYQPNIVCRREGADWKASLTSPEPAALHDELALLLSTSGTTGAAKLVRLSAGNLQANATAIAAYLQLSPGDRAITALPYHYSYGMSVLHTHLLSHAGLVLTAASLMDDEFWSLARRHGVTSLALVPTQFELLEKIAFSREHLPTLRYVTQAGGKLDPIRALDFAGRAKARGWQLFIMYGQTEASPRMSYVPPEDAEKWHHSIGRPVDGGTFRLIDAAGEEITRSGEPGELVFEGPNVMLGYAQARSDLGDPAGPPVLKTGDIAERLENGYFRITGRTSRFIKLFGLRISLDEVENGLRAQNHRAYVSGSDENLVVFLQDGHDPAALRSQIARRYQWPERVVKVVPLAAIPLMSSGKVDYRELSRRAASIARERADDVPSNLATLLKSALREASLDPEKSFLGLGGDSLAYLEVQLFLSKRLGNVPEGWERLPLRELFALEESGRSDQTGWQRVPADLIGRVVAILAVIALHSTTWRTGGGSVLLLILVGYSLARFQSEVLFTGQVGKTWRTMLGPIVVVYFAILAGAALKFSPFDREWLFLIENFQRDLEPSVLVPYWFVSTYVQIIVLASLPFLVPRLRARVKAAPFEAGMAALLAVGLLIQMTEINDIFYNVRHRHPIIALELLLAGWCMFFARTTHQRLVATAAILLVWMQNYGPIEANIAALMLGGSLCTLWGVRVSLPRQAARGLLFFGSLSMFVYLAHVPVLYALSKFVDSGVLMFSGAVVVSLAVAQAMKKTSDLVLQRLARYMPHRRSAAAIQSAE
jgi:acyl-CoA synthetase (AMP-forming)/AMP-acid ligase II/peptidoglycan/LPS O-acetylase OafA/YrhL